MEEHVISRAKHMKDFADTALHSLYPPLLCISATRSAAKGRRLAALSSIALETELLDANRPRDWAARCEKKHTVYQRLHIEIVVLVHTWYSNSGCIACLRSDHHLIFGFRRFQTANARLCILHPPYAPAAMLLPKSMAWHFNIVKTQKRYTTSWSFVWSKLDMKDNVFGIYTL